MQPYVLEAALTREQREAGFSLVPHDDTNDLELRHGCDLVATYSINTVTIAVIRYDAARYTMEQTISELGRRIRQ